MVFNVTWLGDESLTFQLWNIAGALNVSEMVAPNHLNLWKSSEDKSVETNGEKNGGALGLGYWDITLAMGSFVAFRAGYRLVMLRKVRAPVSPRVTKRRVEGKIRASGIKNVDVITAPVVMPRAPLAKTRRRAWVKTIFTTTFGLAPRARIMPNSRC